MLQIIMYPRDDYFPDELNCATWSDEQRLCFQIAAFLDGDGALDLPTNVLIRQDLNRDDSPDDIVIDVYVDTALVTESERDWAHYVFSAISDNWGRISTETVDCTPRVNVIALERFLGGSTEPIFWSSRAITSAA